MALESLGLQLSMVATETLTSGQFKAMKFVSGTDLGVAAASAATDPPAGILQNKPASGAAAAVMAIGVSKYIAGGTVHVGDKLTVTTGGKLIATTTKYNNVWGIALTEADADDIGTMLVNLSGAMVSLA